MGKQYFNIQEVSEYLGISVNTLYEWVHRRMIPFHKFGKSVRFEKSDIDNWARGCRIEAVNVELIHSN